MLSEYKVRILGVFCLMLEVVAFSNSSTKGIEISAGTNSTCLAEEGFFQCSNGDCISRGLVRDSFLDCKDASDENRGPLNCSDDEVRCRLFQGCSPRHQMFHSCNLYRELPCRKEEFTCAQTRLCIKRHMVLDGERNCKDSLLDYSDETGGLETCFPNEFECRLSKGLRCIPRHWVMNGVNDCRDNASDEAHPLTCNNKTEFRCPDTGRCLLRLHVLNGRKDCPGGQDELRPLTCHPESEFRCASSGRCIPRRWRNDGIQNCRNGSDELPFNASQSCSASEFRCHHTGRCLDSELVCDGIDQCGDCSDEIEACREPVMARCTHDTGKCFPMQFACDGIEDCKGGSDENWLKPGFKCFMKPITTKSTLGPKYCTVPQSALNDSILRCLDKSDLCYKDGKLVCDRCSDGRTIISPNQICDGVFDCPWLTDECLCSKKKTKANNTALLCDQICYSVKDSKPCRTCKVGEIKCPGESRCLNLNQVCDGRVDCATAIDEEFCTKKFEGPARAPPKDFICDNTTEDLQSILRGARKVGFSNFGFRDYYRPNATRCNGVVECMNYEDECSARANCSQKPKICQRIPIINFTFPSIVGFKYTMRIRLCQRPYGAVPGFLACDGVVDCPDQEDEENCPNRYYCDAGVANRIWKSSSSKIISISKKKICDGILPTDCKDQSDEMNCSLKSHFYCLNKKPLFVPRSVVLDGKADCSDFSDECPRNFAENSLVSSREELIGSIFLQVCLWLMCPLALLGNGFILVKCVIYFKTKLKLEPGHDNLSMASLNRILVFNLALFDSLTGVVLLIIGIKQTQFSGLYCLRDKAWRSSSTCSRIGAISLISNEGSVLTLVSLTCYRIYGTFYPFKSKNLQLRKLLLLIGFLWLFVIFLSLLPDLPAMSQYTIDFVWTRKHPQFANDLITSKALKTFAQRLWSLSAGNVSIPPPPSNLFSLNNYLSKHFQSQAPTIKGYFSFYSASSVCLPKLYKDPHFGYSFFSAVILAINFAAMLFNAAAYVVIYRKATKKVEGGSVTLNSSSSTKSRMLQKKITLLVMTNICCWLPVCVMALVSIGGVILSKTSYSVSIVLLLPINSALNPLIYTDTLGIVKNLYKRFSQSLLHRQK